MFFEDINDFFESNFLVLERHLPILGRSFQVVPKLPANTSWKIVPKIASFFKKAQNYTEVLQFESMYV